MRVLHVVGSPTSDFHADLSLVYARDALATLATTPHEHVVAFVSPDRRWRFPQGLSAADLEAAQSVELGGAVVHLGNLGVDAVVPQMFCTLGMTAYRALTEEVLGLPLLGNPASVMALAADKAATRAVVAAAGVDVPPGELVRPGEHPASNASPPTFPVVVKPAASDNSWGLSLVRTAEELAPALERAWEHGAALVEHYVELGREVRCGVLDLDGELAGLPLEEYAVDAVSHPVRIAEDKLAPTDPDGRGIALMAKDPSRSWIVPAPRSDPDPVTTAVHEAAKVAHRAMGGRHYGLFDFRIDPDGRPWLLEAGPYCSFARTSVVAVMAAAAGIDTPALFERVLAAAVSR